MKDETDRRDARLLASGKLDELFAIYRPILAARARLRRLSEPEVDDVVQNAMLRVYSELARGRDYGCPIRVVFHMVLQWSVSDYFGASAKHRTVPLGDWDAGAPDREVDRVVERDFLVRTFASLPPRERFACYLYFMADMAPKEIAKTLGMTRNAVDQAIFRAKRRMKGILGE
jgi:RNA polymerase sigma factor (sigma-70 family)